MLVDVLDLHVSMQMLVLQLEQVRIIDQEDSSEKNGEPEMDLSNFKLSELLEMKQTTDEVYGNGTFDRAVGEDLARLWSKLMQQNNAEGTESKETDKRKTYKEMLSSSNGNTKNDMEVVPLMPTMMPKLEGGNVVVQIDERDYQKAVKDLQFSVIGRITLQNKEAAPTTMEIRRKLEAFWQISNLKLIALGRGCFDVLLHCMSDQSTAMSKGPVNLKPGIFRVSRWLPGFNPANQVLSTTQVWIRLKELPIEYRTPQNLFNIASGVGFPLKIDPLTMSLGHGLFARLLVDVNLAKPLPEKILVTRAASNTNFFVFIEYERIPKYCSMCGFIGHEKESCKRNSNGGMNSAPVRMDFVQKQQVRKTSMDNAQNIMHPKVRSNFMENQVHVNLSQHLQENQQQQYNCTAQQDQNIRKEPGIEEGEKSQREETSVSAAKSKPWQLDKESLRSEKLDKMATEIGQASEEGNSQLVSDAQIALNSSTVHSGNAQGLSDQQQSFEEEGNDNEKRKKPSWADDGENENIIGAAVNSGRFQALQDVEEDDSQEENRSDKDSDDEEMNIEKIYWIKETELYAHASGMRYDTKSKNYFTWVTDEVEDRRCLYYFPFQGVLKLIRTGKRGELNNVVLRDMDWNRSRIYTEKSYGYRRDLHKLFRDHMANTV